MMRHSPLHLAILLAGCRLCGAFFAPPAAATTATSAAPQHRAFSSSPTSPPSRGEHGSKRASSVRMQQQQPGSDQELQVAVRKLAEQVEDLTAMVAQLAAEPVGSVDTARAINGGVVEGGVASVPVVSTKSKDGSKPLVRYDLLRDFCHGPQQNIHEKTCVCFILLTHMRCVSCVIRAGAVFGVVDVLLLFWLSCAK